MRTVGFVLMVAALVVGVPAMFVVARRHPQAAALVGVGALAVHALGNWMS